MVKRRVVGDVGQVARRSAVAPRHPFFLAIMLLACHTPLMANLQVKNIPDALHDRLRAYARESNSTIGAAVLAAVERELAAWEWRKRLAQRPQTDLGMEAAELLREERSLRDQETD